MKVFHGRTSSAGIFRQPKVTLGTFDGVHRGHQQVLGNLQVWARATDTDAVVVTFDHKPRRVLAGSPGSRIMSLPHRLLLLERLGLDVVVVLKFDRTLASTEPEDFVREVLVGDLGASGVLLGHDTHFGRNARGDFDLIQRMGKELGFEACSIAVVQLDGQPISSTRLREAIRSGNLSLAERLTGRRVSIYGTVVPGTERGRSIGYPTANLNLHHEVHPPQGVYTTRTMIDGVWRGSVTNIGRPPTLQADGPTYLSEKVVVETHVLDFDGDLYGKDLEIQFVDRIRSEQVFHSPDALAQRIAADIQEARRRLPEAPDRLDAPP